MKTCILILLSQFLYINVLYAQSTNIPEVKLTLWQQFQNQEGDNWTIRWKEDSNVPRILADGVTKLYSGSPESIGFQFFREYAELFSFNEKLNGLIYIETIPNKVSNTVVFKQEYQNLSVEGAEYRVNILNNGSINFVNGHWYPEIEISTQSSVTKSNALAQAKLNSGLSVLDNDISKAELVILPQPNNSFKLAYKAELYSDEAKEHWLYFIDAENGSMISKANQMSSFFHSVKPKTQSQQATGSASVYTSHPGLTSLTTETLHRLNGNNKLDGTYVKVLKYPGSSSVTGTNNNFIYSAGDPGIDETMPYFHVDDFRHNYLNSLDPNISISKIEVLVSAQAVAPLGDCNGVYNISGHEILLSDGDGTNCFNASLEDKVIQHEYTHAWVYELNSGLSSAANDQEGAINEGIADYFTGSYTDRTNIGDYLAPDDGIGFDRERSMTNPVIQDSSMYDSLSITGDLDVNLGGEFLSSILWDFRESPNINPSIADEVIFEAIKAVNGDPDFKDLQVAMRTKGLELGGLLYRKEANNRFADKGIGAPYPLVVTASGPTEMDEGDTETWSASSDGVAPFTYEWSIIPVGSTGSGTVLGTGSTYTGGSNQTGDFDLLVKMTDVNDYEGTGRLTISVDDGGGCPPTFPCKAVTKDLPSEFGLSNNYPNPFNPSTQIKFELPERSDVSIIVYNIMGQKVATLINEQMNAGFHNTSFKADNLSSGVYIARLSAISSSGKKFTEEIKMQLIK